MNVIKRHKGLAVLLGLALILIGFILVILFKMVIRPKSSVYGDRLNGISDIDSEIMEKVETDLEEMTAVEAAKKNVIKVPLVNGYRTIPHATVGVYGAGNVVMRPAAEGTGVIAGGAIRDVFELVGCTDVVTKCVGSRTSINMVRATFAGFKSLKTVNGVAKTRGLKVEEVR